MVVKARYSFCGQSGTVEELDLIKGMAETFWAVSRSGLGEIWVYPCIENFAPTCLESAE